MNNNKYKKEGNSLQESHVNIDFYQKQLKNQTNMDNLELYLRGSNPEYDEIDLLSECSTPVTYIPGKYLQLCDIDTHIDVEVNLWPVSSRPSLTERDMISHLPGATRQADKEGYLYNHTTRQMARLSQASSRLVITIAVCVIVAFTALGCLATFV